MYLAGLDLKVGPLFSLKILLGKNSPREDCTACRGSKKDCQRADECLYKRTNPEHKKTGNSMMAYDRRGSTVFFNDTPGVNLRRSA